MRAAALLLTLLPAVVAAAAPPPCTAAVPADRTACRKTWTVLVYLAGDAEDLRAPFECASATPSRCSTRPPCACACCRRSVG